MSRTSRWAFVAVVLAVTAAFVRLGTWQLDRLHERRAENRRARERLRRPPLELGFAERDLAAGGPGRADTASGTGADRGDGAATPGMGSLPSTEGGDTPGRAEALSLPTDAMDRRRVVLRGRFDYGREVVLAPRSFGGTPGVYLLTPLVVGDSAAVPVLRGALPAPDGYHAALEKARPPRARGRVVTVRGVALLPPDVEPVERPDTLRSAGGAHPVLPRLDLERVDALLPWRVPGWYVRADSTTEEIPPAEGIRVPAPVPPPALDDGPHLMYAIQWFAFAAIGLVGGGVFLVLRTRGDGGAGRGGSGDGGAGRGGTSAPGGHAPGS